MDEYVIVQAREDDAEGVLTYLKIIGGESDNLTFGAEGVPFSVEEERAFIQSRLDSKTNVLYLVKHKGEIIGNGSINGMSGRMSHRAELGISVRKDHWGHGVGTMLMERLIAFAEHAGFEILCLDVRSDNDRAIHLYKKFGFERIATYPGFMKIKGNLVDYDLMSLSLK